MSEEEKDDLQHIHRLLFQDLKFCGCGDPEAVYELVRDLLELFGERTDYIRSLSPGEWATGGPRTCEQVRERITNSEAAYYAILYWLDGADLLEHGGSVGASWLTEKGYHYLGLMRAHEYRDMEDEMGHSIIVGMPHHDPDKPWDDPSQGVCGPGCRHWEASTPEYVKRDLKKEGK